MDTRDIARQIAEESIVLLKNEEQTLPLAAGNKIAFFGRAQTETIFSGNGSGAVHMENSKKILEECEKNGLKAVSVLKTFYEEKSAGEVKTAVDEFDFTKIKDVVNSGIMYEVFGVYRPPVPEYEIPEELIKKAASETDTAILIIGRNSGGEECDRHLEEDYYLTLSEQRLVEQVCGTFEKVAVILNCNGVLDLSWMKNYPTIKSLLFLGIPGEEGAAALADILTGKITPSGKLAFTLAEQFADYPTAGHFTWEKEKPEQICTYETYGLSAKENGSFGFVKSPVTVYKEGIYLGYRYFDTFGKRPLYPFGYGLSYTKFVLRDMQIETTDVGIVFTGTVKNVGTFAGKEVVQLYVSARNTESEVPFQELKGFQKTSLLNPGKEEKICIRIPWRELAHFEEKSAAYVIERGEYDIRIGTASSDTKIVGTIPIETDRLIEQLSHHLEIRKCNRDKLTFLHRPRENDRKNESIRKIEDERTECSAAKESEKEKTMEERAEKEKKIWSTVKNLSIRELAALCVGYGPGTPFSAIGQCTDPETIFDEEGNPVTTNDHPTGRNGYVSPAIVSKGISSIFYKDGPAGIGEMAWPTAMLTACSFNTDIWYQFGNAVGWECEKQQVDVWLAPAVNLHRHPLCGRNFEYFSEDPFLTGVCACRIAEGVQENHPVRVCAKHFAVNEQETYRRGSKKKNYDAVDSILPERAVRELYLKPFEMLVKEAGISFIMTSFNKINGVFAGGNPELCNEILRGEWKFDGLVVTDWGDMDIVVDGADAIASGNDIVMPGGPPVIGQILKGYEKGCLSRKNLEKAVFHLLKCIKYEM